ncbi:MAG: hypothetical protein LC101_12530 [Flavobacteriales bacterium]|nr:hypothetical protein [Flavobacteriales bacterium]
MRVITLLVLSLSLIISSCTEKEYVLNNLPGTWNIAEYQRVKIDSSGHRQIILDEQNVGSWIIYDDASAAGFLDYEFNYVGSQGNQSQTGVLTVSDEAMRLILIGGCIGCDKHFIIEMFRSEEILLNSYAPIQDTVIFQLTMRLKKI